MEKLSIKKSISRFIENWVEEIADPFTSWLYQSVLHFHGQNYLSHSKSMTQSQNMKIVPGIPRA